MKFSVLFLSSLLSVSCLEATYDRQLENHEDSTSDRQKNSMDIPSSRMLKSQGAFYNIAQSAITAIAVMGAFDLVRWGFKSSQHKEQNNKLRKLQEKKYSAMDIPSSRMLRSQSFANIAQFFTGTVIGAGTYYGAEAYIKKLRKKSKQNHTLQKVLESEK